MAGGAADERLPHPERVVLEQHVPDAGRREPVRAQQSLEPGGGVMDPMAGHVEVVPALAADPRLEARQVRHSDHEAAARPQPRADPVERRAWVLEMLEHVPQRHHVQRTGLDCGVLEGDAGDLGGARLAAARRRLDPERVVSGGARRGHEAAAAGARVKQPRRWRRERAHERQALPVEQPQDRAGGAVQPRGPRPVRARVVETRWNAPERHRRTATAAPCQLESRTAQ